MYNIAFFHNKVGKTDGVSLEIYKWSKVLEGLGYNVFYCAGNDDKCVDFIIPELSFAEPLTNKILRNGTVKFRDYDQESQLEEDIFYQAEIIENKIMNFISKFEIDILIPNNLLSVGYNIPAMIALNRVIRKTKLPTINHNHDFYFEDSDEVHITSKMIEDIMDKYSVPNYSHVINLVINKIAQKELYERKGIKAEVVPNVFDFNNMVWEKDEFNKDFREKNGIKNGDIVFLQATRVLDRKAIELAIDLIAVLNQSEYIKMLLGNELYDSRNFTEKNELILLCSGYVEEYGISGDYYNNLKKHAKEKGVNIKFVGDTVKHKRQYDIENKVYSLWDSYIYADFVTYPSIWEGFGNQFLEAVNAKLPIALYEYPVFKSDLMDDGFKYVSLGDEISGRDEMGLINIHENFLKQAAAEVVSLLLNKDAREEATENNYQIAKNNYSYQVLEGIIKYLFDSLDL